MTVIVRVAGWLPRSFLVSMFTKRNNSSILFRKRPKFSQHYCSPRPPPTLTHQPSGSFLSTFPYAYNGRAVFAKCVNYMQRGGGSGRGGEGGCGGGVGSLVSSEHHQCHIFSYLFFIFQKFLCFLHFLLLFVYARNLGTLLFIIVVAWPFQHMPIFRITNLINFGTFILTNEIFLNINYFPSQFFFGFERKN